MLLNAHELMTPDRPLKYLSRQYVRVHAHDRQGFKVCLLYLKNTLTGLQQLRKMSVCGTRAVPGRKKSGPTVEQVGEELRMLGANDHSRYRAGVGKLQFMINEVPEINRFPR